MTWTKLSDDFSDDCWDLSSDAFRLHVEGLTWSNRKLLDLRIPKSDLRRFAKFPDAVTELVAVGWWADSGDVYVIRHHAVYQRTREAVLRQQEARQENGRKGGRPPKHPREQARSITKTEPETYPVSSPVSEQRTERDRTGLDRNTHRATTKTASTNGHGSTEDAAHWAVWTGQAVIPDR